MPHEDSVLLLDIIQSIRRAIEGLGNIGIGEFRNNWKIQSIVLHQLLILGEAVKRLSPDFRNQHPTVPWKRIAGLRDILIHSYDIVDYEAVWLIVNRDLPSVLEQLENSGC